MDLSPHLGETRNEVLKSRFSALTTRRDLADLLEVPFSVLDWHVRRNSEDSRYRTFKIPKRSGLPRTIDAPIGGLAILQRKLAAVLTAAYPRKGAAYGFVPGVSIIQNAERHVSKQVVLNIDIEDFFHAIRFHRVVGCLIRPPFGIGKDAALAVAQLGCHNGRLPAGAPSSPIISNIVCMRLDSVLRRRAENTRCTYTRYCDDISISTSRRHLPVWALQSTGAQGRTKLGSDLVEILSAVGFRPNAQKTRVMIRGTRQVVTGLTVNGARPSIPRPLLRRIRALCHQTRVNGYSTTNATFRAKDATSRFRKGDPPELIQYLRGQRAYFRMVLGSSHSAVVELDDVLYGLGAP